MNQYYFNRGNVRIEPEEGDHVVDAGGFIGDTAIRFALDVGHEGCVYSFEPVANNLQLMEVNIRCNNLKNVVIIPYGLSNVHNEGSPITLKDETMADGVGIGFNIDTTVKDANVPLAMLDELGKNKTVKRVDYIKMDIEGIELRALEGAELTIRAFKPKLAICIYHTYEHLYGISQWIKNLDLGYRMFIDMYSFDGTEQILYATCDPK